MYSCRYFEKILESLGYQKEGNICDFWFDNMAAVGNTVDHHMKAHMDRFGLEIRWKSKIGLVCNEAVRQYLNEKQKQHCIEHQPRISTGNYFSLCDIDFSQFNFLYDNKSVNLDEFVSHFPTSKFTGLSDLRGINLTNISIKNAAISNANFAYANFKSSHLFQLRLCHVNFVSADLSDSCIGNVTLDGNSGIPGADLKVRFRKYFAWDK